MLHWLECWHHTCAGKASVARTLISDAECEVAGSREMAFDESQPQVIVYVMATSLIVNVGEGHSCQFVEGEVHMSMGLVDAHHHIR